MCVSAKSGIHWLERRMSSRKRPTSGGKTKFGGGENGHEFELRTMTEKSTKMRKNGAVVNDGMCVDDLPISSSFLFSQYEQYCSMRFLLKPIS
jgi:hypothetical protein